MELCENILFIHALLGCDTISSVFGIGQGASLKASNQSRYFREQAHVFAKYGVIIETFLSRLLLPVRRFYFIHIKEQMMIIWTALAIECSAKKWLQADSISSQKFSHHHLQLQNVTRFGYFTKLGSGWVKTLVRLNGGGGSRMNRCNQQRQILDVCQVNCYH